MTSTLRKLQLSTLPMSTGWYLNSLGEFKGKQDLYIQQSPQRLKTLRQHAIIESAVSSNRMEGVEVDPSRVRDLLIAPKPLFRDRDEEEIRGYRDALSHIHIESSEIKISNETIMRLHALTRGQIWDAGIYKEKDGDIIEKYPDGTERIRFRTVPAVQTMLAMNQLIADWSECLEDQRIPPAIALAAFNLDFLCIHPFRDGNGRVSRLLWLLQSYHSGFEVGKYISLERLIEQNKVRYYETLEQSSQGWHEGKHDPWPFINYVLPIIKMAYVDFVERVGDIKAPRGEKRDVVKASITKLLARKNAAFSISELDQMCPGVSRDMVRHVVREQQSMGEIECRGRGPGTLWTRLKQINGSNSLPLKEGNNKGND